MNALYNDVILYAEKLITVQNTMEVPTNQVTRN